ncbi:protein rogdi homolog isoform X1 [Notamacropus eugenii]|uniref:protein rogdi homolog isoform X1 n=1 Tax=Notamacropus eugenii TaxID=9315 RepID=UPI003B6823F1
MATAMAATAAERAVLEEEFRWLLHDEVHAVLRQLQDILKEASYRFTLPGAGTEGPARQENFILGSSTTDQVKGVLTLQGDALSQADVNLKIPRNNQLLHFAFREDKQWKLQQIQDARNHVSQAIYLLANRDESYQFKTGAEVLKLMDAVMLQLTRARNRLTTPATLTLPEIASSGLTVSARNRPAALYRSCGVEVPVPIIPRPISFMRLLKHFFVKASSAGRVLFRIPAIKRQAWSSTKIPALPQWQSCRETALTIVPGKRMFAPALPADLLVNFYINLNKLCLTVYQLHALQPSSTKNFRPAGGAVLHSPGAMFEWGTQRLEVSHVHKVECVVPWLNDALVFFTVSLQLCQQLKDKISVFSSYWSYRPF